MKWILIGVVVAATTVGEVLQSMGMRRHGEIHDFRPGALGRVLGALARNWMLQHPCLPWRFPSSLTWDC